MASFFSACTTSQYPKFGEELWQLRFQSIKTQREPNYSCPISSFCFPYKILESLPWIKQCWGLKECKTPALDCFFSLSGSATTSQTRCSICLAFTNIMVSIKRRIVHMISIALLSFFRTKSTGDFNNK